MEITLKPYSLAIILSTVRGTVVYNDYFEIGIIDLFEAFQAVADGALSVVGANENRDARPVEIGGEGDLRESFADAGKRELGIAVPVGQAESPIVDIKAAPVPFIGPGKDENTGAPRPQKLT